MIDKTKLDELKAQMEEAERLLCKAHEESLAALLAQAQHNGGGEQPQ